MPFGILECKKMEVVPGTGKLLLFPNSDLEVQLVHTAIWDCDLRPACTSPTLPPRTLNSVHGR
jgi:hypothetical protein